MGINIFLPLSWKREGYRELKEQKGVVGGRGDRMVQKKKRQKMLLCIYRILEIVSTSFLAWLLLYYLQVVANICEKLMLLAWGLRILGVRSAERRCQGTRMFFGFCVIEHQQQFQKCCYFNRVGISHQLKKKKIQSAEPRASKYPWKGQLSLQKAMRSAAIVSAAWKATSSSRFQFTVESL